MTCHLPTVSVLNSPVMYFVPGFEITIDHPHTDVVKCSQLVRGRGFLLCSLCPLLLSVPPQMWVGRGVKNPHDLMFTWTHTFVLFDDLLSSLYDKAHKKHVLRLIEPSPRLNCIHLFFLLLNVVTRILPSYSVYHMFSMCYSSFMFEFTWNY